MLPLIHLLTASRAGVTLRAVITVGAVAGGAAWAVSLDKNKDLHEPDPIPASQPERASVPESPEVIHQPVRPQFTIFIVNSEATATVMRARSRELVQFQLQSWLPVSHDEVIIVPVRTDAVRLGESLAHEGSIMSASDMQGFTVVVVDSPAAS